jgi:hypothetical protein
MKSLYFFLALVIGFFVVIFTSEKILNIEHLAYNSLSEKLTAQEINKFFELQKKIKLIGYFINPLILLVKTFMVATILYIGTYFFCKKELSFKALWEIAIKAEFIFLLVSVCKLIWFYFFQTNFILEDIQYFYPLSSLNILDYHLLDPWLIYPLQALNLFEFTYIILLSYQIGNLTKTNTDLGLKIVASSYIPALFLWVIVVMFFTLNFS